MIIPTTDKEIAEVAARWWAGRLENLQFNGRDVKPEPIEPEKIKKFEQLLAKEIETKLSQHQIVKLNESYFDGMLNRSRWGSGICAIFWNASMIINRDTGSIQVKDKYYARHEPLPL